jgi:hypothetical protein
MDLFRCDKSLDCCHNENEAKELNKNRRMRHLQGMEWRRADGASGTNGTVRDPAKQSSYTTAYAAQELMNGNASHQRQAETVLSPALSSQRTVYPGSPGSTDRSSTTVRTGDSR